jgi:hypothetical protein
MIPLTRPANTPSAYPLNSSSSDAHVLSNNDPRSSINVWSTRCGPGKYIAGRSISFAVIRSHAHSRSSPPANNGARAEIHARAAGDTRRTPIASTPNAAIVIRTPAYTDVRTTGPRSCRA